MIKKIKIIAVFAAGLLILSAGVALYMKSRQFTEHLKTVINKQGSDYLQSEVTVGRIDTDIFNNLILSNVIINDPSTLEQDIYIPKIKVKYSFIKLLKNVRNIPQLISGISLYNPKFNIVKTPEGFTVPGLKELDKAGTGTGAVPPWKLNIVNADISLIISSTQTYRSRDFNSTVMLGSYPEIYSRCKFSVEGIARNIDIEAQYHIIDKKVNADILVPAFILESLGEIDTGYQNVKFEKGAASLSLNAAGWINTFDDLIETVDINGEIKVSNAVSGDLSIIDANINISPHRFRIDRAAIRWKNEVINVSGLVSDYLRNPYLDIEVSGEIAARELLGQSKIKDISGIFDVEGYLRGSPGRLEAAGRVSMTEGTVRGYRINNLNTTAQISTSTIKIGAGEMEVAGGRLRWTGQWDIENEFDITATAEEISMARLTGVDRIMGAMSGNITARGGPDSPSVNSDITIEDFTVPGKNFGRLDAQFNYDNSEITVSGFSIDSIYSINGRLHLTGQGNRLNIESLEIKGVDDGLIKSTGYMRYSPFLMEIETTGTDISYLDLPGFTELYKDASGNVSFSGSLSIKSDEARIGGRFAADNLMLGSRSYTGKADIAYHFKEGRKVFQIDGLDINDTVHGSIKMVYEKEELTLESSSVTAVSADMGSILKVLKLPDDKLDGGVSGSFIFSSGEGRGSFVSENVQYGRDSLGALTADFNYDGTIWDIDEISLNNESGSLKIDGTFAEDQKLDIELNGYEFSGRFFNGRGSYRGNWSRDQKYSYSLQMDNFAVDGSKWSNIDIAGEYEDSAARAEIKVADTLAGTVSAGFNDDEELRGKINLNNVKVKNILTALKAESIFNGNFTGELSGVVDIKGTKSNPRATLTKSKIKGAAGGIIFEGRSDLSYGENNFYFNNFSGNIGNRGKYEVTGSFGGKESSEAEFSFEDIDLKVLESVVGFPETFGRGNISGTISGDIKSPDVVLDFTGHNLTVGKEKINRLNIVNARYHQAEINIKEVGFELENGALSLKDGKVIFSDRGQFDVAAAIRFENFTAGPVTLFGSADFKGEIDTDPFAAELEVSPRNILVNRLRVENPMRLTYKNSRLNLKESRGFSAQIDFKSAGRVEIVSELNRNGAKLFSASGYFEGARELRGNINATDFEINNVIRMMDSPVDYYGVSDFSLSINKSTGHVYADGRISVRSGKYNDIAIDQLMADFNYKDGELILAESYIRDANFLEITVSGTAGEESNMDVDIKQLSLAGLKGIVPEIERASGYFTGKYHISGPISKPSITGRAELAGGRIDGRAVFDRIKDIDCLLVASGSRVNIEKFSAGWDPGKLSGSGYLDFTGSSLNYDILLKTVGDKGVVVKAPGLDIPQSGLFGRFLTLPTSGHLKGVARFFFDESAPRLDADLVLEDAQFTYPPTSRGAEEPGDSDFLDKLILNIDLAAGKSVWYENTYARLRLDGAINFFKDSQGPLIVNGELTSSQGEVAYLKRTFRIQRARLIFENSNEYISATATSGISRRTPDGDWVDDEISLIIPQDRLANIVPRFSSRDFEEDKTSEDSAAIAIAGEEFSRLNQQERRDLLRKELLRAIDANLTSPLVKNILSRTSIIDVARVDIGLSEEAPDGSVTIERTGLELGSHLTDKLYMGYYMQMGPGYENKLRLSHELDVLYRLQTNQFLRGTFDEDRGFFLGLEHRIRF